MLGNLAHSCGCGGGYGFSKLSGDLVLLVGQRWCSSWVAARALMMVVMAATAAAAGSNRLGSGSYSSRDGSSNAAAAAARACCSGKPRRQGQRIPPDKPPFLTSDPAARGVPCLEGGDGGDGLMERSPADAQTG